MEYRTQEIKEGLKNGGFVHALRRTGKTTALAETAFELMHIDKVSVVVLVPNWNIGEAFLTAFDSIAIKRLGRCSPRNRPTIATRLDQCRGCRALLIDELRLFSYEQQEEILSNGPTFRHFAVIA